MTDKSLGSGFMASCERFPSRPALEVAGTGFSYEELQDRSLAIAATLQHLQPGPPLRLTAVLAHRSVTAFSGILAALLRGHGYVPLNPNFPADRTATMLERSGSTALVVGEEARGALAEVLPLVDTPLLVVLPDSGSASDLAAAFPQHTFACEADLRPATDREPAAAGEADTAYLLFTSGSTGIPKGVEVAHRNIRRFIDVMSERYRFTQEDRFSQMFELVFDLSLFDLFLAWENGACICCPSKGDARMPAKYIIDSKISVWFSVPSLALAMKQMRMLKAGLYPDLRLSLFCGEALLAEVAEAWADAAPNSILENLYGPTEVTLACTLYRWDPETSPSECEHGLVPIGYPYPGMTAVVVDENLTEVAAGQDGELLMSGPQVATGYWNDPDKTATAFVSVPGREGRFYRTGDLVRCPGGDGLIKYRGRIDHQVKIRGNRVELGEIEQVLRTVAGNEMAVAIGWPRIATGVDGIVAFVQAYDGDLQELRAEASARLPDYMAPKDIRSIPEMPLNANGKVDRKQLLAMLEQEQAQGRS